jgi:predicted acetyltransferase
MEHITGMKSSNGLKVRLSKHEIIDKEFQHQITKENERMRQVLLRIIDVVKFLSKQNLALDRFFQGSDFHTPDMIIKSIQ